MSETRICIRCDMDLPLAAFSRHVLGRDGLSGACRACELERIHYSKHGITRSEKQHLAEAQQGCALCGRIDPGVKGWVVDHDHDCCPGERSCDSCRRGILCPWCNTALGYAQDNPVLLRRMADYLELQTRLVPTPRRSPAASVG